MSISFSQKKIINISRNIINKNKKFNKDRISALTYFALWGDSPGFARVKYNIYGFQNLFNFWFKILKDVVSIAFLNNYEILKNPNFNSKNFNKLIVSRSIIEDFDQKGNYKDRYFLINSNKKKDTLFILINSGIRVPKKIGANVVIIYQKEKSLNLLFFFKYTISKFFCSKFSIKDFFYNTSSSNIIGEYIIDFFKKEIDLNNIKSILVPYEGQPYEHLIFEEARKKNKKILIGGYDHSAPHSIPIHLIYRSFSPDFLYVNGMSQVIFLKKFLKWPGKKLKLAPSLRYPKKLKLDFNNIVFLPYDIFNEQIVIEEFKKIILNYKNFDLKNLKIKNHPMMLDSKKHIGIKLKLEKIIQENIKNIKNIKKIKKRNTAIFIGATTGVIVALEKKST